MPTLRSGSIGCLIVVASTMLVGCGGTDPVRRPLAGSISAAEHDPVNGSISLFPTEGHSGAAISTSVDSGRYEFSSADGPFPGVYQVVIEIEENESARTTDSDNHPTSKVDLRNEPDAPSARKQASSTPVEFRTRLEIEVNGSVEHDFAFP